ncbi:hypothetical protein [Kribbella pratensis]|uniref:Uncharacterized protein n=1 Tax=Kribbella pratensis TaxID=2512112 RepID=A0A4R8CLE2_9ACTN|nr:hypothetical protein [Kribbella pratensis]TDW76851.1 hypothetical protein EV653_2011 [Kribbella pratensis]
MRTAPKLAINRGDHFKFLLVQVLGVEHAYTYKAPAAKSLTAALLDYVRSTETTWFRAAISRPASVDNPSGPRRFGR